MHFTDINNKFMYNMLHLSNLFHNIIISIHRKKICGNRRDIPIMITFYNE